MQFPEGQGNPLRKPWSRSNIGRRCLWQLFYPAFTALRIIGCIDSLIQSDSDVLRQGLLILHTQYCEGRASEVVFVATTGHKVRCCNGDERTGHHPSSTNHNGTAIQDHPLDPGPRDAHRAIGTENLSGARRGPLKFESRYLHEAASAAGCVAVNGPGHRIL